MKRRIELDFTNAAKAEMAKENHIWLNAMSCVRPSDEFLIDLGRRVLNKLDASEMCDDLSETFPVVYIRINKS